MAFEWKFPARLDDQGRMLPRTPEELAAQAEAMEEAFRRMDEIKGDDPELSDAEYLRLLDRKYDWFDRWKARQKRRQMGGVAQQWLHGFSSTLACSGWRRSTRRKTQPQPRSANGPSENKTPETTSA